MHKGGQFDPSPYFDRNQIQEQNFLLQKAFFWGEGVFPPSPLFSHLPTSLKIYGHIVLGMVILLRFYFLTRTDLLHHLFQKKRTQCSKKCIWVVLQTVFVLYLTKKPFFLKFSWVRTEKLHRIKVLTKVKKILGSIFHKGKTRFFQG